MLKYVLLTFCALQAETEWFQESLYDEWGQFVKVDEKVYEEKSDLFDILVFDNAVLGRVLVMDGAVQITQADEFVYQEMMAHVPLFSHGSAKNVLIVGGGDGGVLREVLRHEEVEQVTLVEIEPAVISLSKKYLPFISQGAFENPRADVVIADGTLFVKETDKRFDVIIIDSTDPVGPAGAVLFTQEFYQNCKNILNKDGILVNMSDVPFLQKEVIQTVYTNCAAAFGHMRFYVAAVPTYVGGFMALGFASDKPNAHLVSYEVLEARVAKMQGACRYYSPAIHKASFALPPYIQTLYK